jgi:hypothetical protein
VAHMLAVLVSNRLPDHGSGLRNDRRTSAHPNLAGDSPHEREAHPAGLHDRRLPNIAL